VLALVICLQGEATVVVYSMMRNITALIRRDEKDMVCVSTRVL